MAGKGNPKGTNNGGGRRPRPNASRHNVLIDGQVWNWLNRNGNVSQEIERIARTEMKIKSTYHAFVINDQGASENAGSSYNLTELKADIRRRYGKGWTVVISKVEHDGDRQSWFAPVEIERFTLRK